MVATTRNDILLQFDLKLFDGDSWQNAVLLQVLRQCDAALIALFGKFFPVEINIVDYVVDINLRGRTRVGGRGRLVSL